MSVLKNNRHKSPIEYNRQFSRFSRYIQNRIDRVPMRYYAELIKPFNEAMNKFEDNLSEMTRLLLQKQCNKKERYNICLKAIENLKEIEKLSYVFWNISELNNEIKYIKMKSRNYWAEQLNKLISLIIEEAKKYPKYKEDDYNVYYCQAYPKIKRAKYVNEISRLHQIVVKRSKQMKNKDKNRNIESLLRKCEDALYYAYTGNSVKIIDKKSQTRRLNLLDKAISLLYSMDMPVSELAYGYVFTEEELNNIHKTITTAKKLISGVKNADKALVF